MDFTRLTRLLLYHHAYALITETNRGFHCRSTTGIRLAMGPFNLPFLLPHYTLYELAEALNKHIYLWPKFLGSSTTTTHQPLWAASSCWLISDCSGIGTPLLARKDTKSI